MERYQRPRGHPCLSLRVKQRQPVIELRKVTLEGTVSNLVSCRKVKLPLWIPCHLHQPPRRPPWDHRWVPIQKSGVLLPPMPTTQVLEHSIDNSLHRQRWKVFLTNRANPPAQSSDDTQMPARLTMMSSKRGRSSICRLCIPMCLVGKTGPPACLISRTYVRVPGQRILVPCYHLSARSSWVGVEWSRQSQP